MNNFRTESGSQYEVDYENSRIRRIAGNALPTPRQGADGEWKSYMTISPLVKDCAVVIIWKMAGAIAQSTITSEVKEIWN